MLVLAADLIDWEALFKVILASLIGTVGVTMAFSLAIVGATGVAESRRDGRPGAAIGFGVLAALALAVCVAAIVLGIVVMTQKD